MRWSNGRWKNTVHRVSEPPNWKDQSLQALDSGDAAESGSGGLDAIPERYSIACFGVPDPTTVVEALPGCCRERAARWEPVDAGEYLRRKRAVMYA